MPHRTLLPLLLLLTLLVSLLPPASPARAAGDLYVAPNGNDSGICDTPATPCATLQGAIAKAEPGATIFVAAGTYYGDTTGSALVLVDKDLAFSGGWDPTFSTQVGLSTLDGSRITVPAQTAGLLVGDAAHVMVDAFLFTGFPSGRPVQNNNTLSLTNVTIRDNHSSLPGGAIFSDLYTVLSLERVLIAGNFSSKSGGGISVDSFSKLSLHHTTIQDNTAGSIGGGIFAKLTTVEIVDSTILGNRAGGDYGYGGGVYCDNCKLRIERSAITGNSASGEGGGLNLYNTDAILINTTVSENMATAGGAIRLDPVYPKPLQVYNATITRNTPVGLHLPASARVTLRNSLLAGNGQDCIGSLTSQGYNLFQNPANCSFTPATGDLIGQDPALLPLAGLLGFDPLTAASPAVDSGNPTGCLDDAGQPLTIDARGVSRAGRCDIGAFEWQAPGAPARLLYHSGSGQLTELGNNFSSPLAVMVTDAAGTPVSGAVVTFTAPTGGAAGDPGGAFPGGAAAVEVTSNDQGLAQAPRFTANQVIGNYQVTATLGDLPAIAFDLENDSRVYLPTLASQHCSSEFFDGFENPSSGWYTGEDDDVLVEYLDGEYRVNSKQAGYLYLFRSPTPCLHQRFTLEVDARWVGAVGLYYGLVFGLNEDYTDFYVLYVHSGSGLYSIYHYYSGEFYPIAPGDKSPAIRTGNQSNHLKITRAYSFISIEINGILIENRTDFQGPRPGGVGLLVTSPREESHADARFDNFSVKELPATANKAGYAQNPAQLPAPEALSIMTPAGAPRWQAMPLEKLDWR